MARKGPFCQTDENLPWLRFGEATAAGNPIVECFLRLFALQICSLKRSNVTQPLKEMWRSYRSHAS